MNPVLEDIYRTGKCVDLAGKERKVTGAVPHEDALILQEMARFVKAKKSDHLTSRLDFPGKPPTAFVNKPERRLDFHGGLATLQI